MKYSLRVTDSHAASRHASVYLVALRAGVLLGLVALGACNWSSNTDTPHFGLGGTVSGLTEDGLVLADNGTTLTVNSGASSFSFGAILQKGDSYAVSVKSSPAGLFCSVASGKGTAATADVNNVVVTCSRQAFTLGGTILGLNGSGLVLTDGIDSMAVSASATSFTFPTQVAYTSSYAVTITQQPTGLSCAVTNGTGTIPAANVTSVSVTCSDKPYSLGGTISGLNGFGLVLANGTDTVALPASATSFVMPTKVPYTSKYAVTVFTQPAGLTCTVSNGSGTMPAADVTNLSVICSDRAFALGGTVSGLNGSGLVLANGSDKVSVLVNASSFTLPTAVAYTSPYNVTVDTQPTGLTCSVSNGTGTMPAAAVTSVSVTCSDLTYTLGGTIGGLNLSGLMLQNNGGDDLTVAANAVMFTMPTSVAYLSPYTVTVKTQPLGGHCDVTSGSGTMPAGNVTSVQVLCADLPFTVGGTVTGLAPGASAVLLDNGVDPKIVSANGPFTFSATVLSGSPYAVTVGIQPSSPAQTCSVTGGASGIGSGTVQGANVTNVTVTCTTDAFTIGGTVSGLIGSGLQLQNNGGDMDAVSADGPFTFSTKIASGSSYVVTVKKQPKKPAQTCTVQNDSGTVAGADVTNVTVTCMSNATFTIGGNVTGLGSGVNVVLQNNAADDLTASANGSFAFATTIADGDTYAVTVLTEPANGQTCLLANATGTVAGADVTNVTVSCTPKYYTISGSVSNLTGSGLVLQNNGGDDLTVSASSTTFQFATSVVDGGSYAVTVLSEPVAQICLPASNTGTVAGGNVADVTLSCFP